MGVQRRALHSPSSFFQHVFDFPFSFFPCWKKLRAHPASELFLKEGDLLRLLGESQTVRRPFSSSLFRLVGEDGGRPQHLTSTLFLGSEVLLSGCSLLLEYSAFCWQELLRNSSKTERSGWLFSSLEGGQGCCPRFAPLATSLLGRRLTVPGWLLPLRSLPRTILPGVGLKRG